MEIGALAFYDTGLQGTLMITSRVTKIGSETFWNTELGLDLSPVYLKHTVAGSSDV